MYDFSHPIPCQYERLFVYLLYRTKICFVNPPCLQEAFKGQENRKYSKYRQSLRLALFFPEIFSIFLQKAEKIYCQRKD